MLEILKLIMEYCLVYRSHWNTHFIFVLQNTTVECRYYSKNAQGKYVKIYGCALMCNRTYTVSILYKSNLC